MQFLLSVSLKASGEENLLCLPRLNIKHYTHARGVSAILSRYSSLDYAFVVIFIYLSRSTTGCTSYPSTTFLPLEVGFVEKKSVDHLGVQEYKPSKNPVFHSLSYSQLPCSSLSKELYFMFNAKVMTWHGEKMKNNRIMLLSWRYFITSAGTFSNSLPSMKQENDLLRALLLFLTNTFR